MAITYTSAHSPKFTASASIELVVNFDHLGEVPFTACLTDVEAHSRELYARAIAGEFGQIAPYVEPPPARIVPRSVSRFQARAALLQAGLLDDVEAYMTLPETDPIYRLAWQDAQEFRRDSVIVASLKSVLLLTDVQIDDLFVFAASITG